MANEHDKEKKKKAKSKHGSLIRSQTQEVSLSSSIYRPSSSSKDESFTIQTNAPQPSKYFLEHNWNRFDFPTFFIFIVVICSECLLEIDARQLKT